VTSDSNLLDSIDDPFVAIDATCRVIRLNRAFERLFGLRASSSVGRELFSLAESLQDAPLEAEIHAALAKDVAGRSMDSMTIDGRAFELRASPLNDGGLALLFLDVTHRVEDDRRTANALGRIAHDFRNRLAPLLTSLELLKRPNIAEETKTKARAIMGRQVDQMVGLIDEVQDIARGGRGATRSAGLGRAEAGNGASKEVDSLGELEPREVEPRDSTDKGARVLVADDSDLVQQSVVALLVAEGYEVRTVSDGIEAVAAAEDWRPRYVLLDLHMPRLGGMEAAKRLRQSPLADDMVLLMMSGVTLDDSWREHARQAGFDVCVDKTADPAEWLAAMRQVGKRRAGGLRG